MSSVIYSVEVVVNKGTFMKAREMFDSQNLAIKIISEKTGVKRCNMMIMTNLDEPVTRVYECIPSVIGGESKVTNKIAVIRHITLIKTYTLDPTIEWLK